MFLVCLAAAESANAATYTVTTTADFGASSLRAAVALANGTPDSDKIEFAIPASDAGCTGGVCTITLTSGELKVASAATASTLTINNSTGAGNLLISGNNTSRVFYLNSGANLTIYGITITNGNVTGGFGGGIYCDRYGTIVLINSILSGNSSSYRGGGIYNDAGAVTLTNSILSGNSSADGGGILSGGSVKLTNSTISGNTARYEGGGIYNSGSTMTLTNSTVSGNTAYSGGGITSVTPLNLKSVTVTQNKSTGTSCTTCVAGINNYGTANLQNTLVAGNITADPFASPDFRGKVAAGSNYNLIGNGQGMTGITNGDGSHNQVGVDPLLDPTLQLNGGTTPNHALLAGSPAIDKGFSFLLMYDQRGFHRTVDFPDADYPNGTDSDGSDIGAFEFQAAQPQFIPCTYSLTTATQNFTASGGTGAFSVSTRPDCGYIAVSSSNFISIDYDSGGVGSGSGTIIFFVQANTTDAARTGTITVVDQTLTITQEAGKSKKRTRIILP